MSDALPKAGAAVRVVAGPHRGKTGTVKRVLKMPGEAASAALVLVHFKDGGEGFQVGANLVKLEAAERR
jgi:hypothetical protein